MKSKVIIGAVLISLVVIPNIHAQANTWLGPTGLFGIYTADTLEKGSFAGSFYFSNYDRELDLGEGYDPLSLDYSYLSLCLAYGLTDRLEISVSPQYVDIRRSMKKSWSDETDGMGDIYLNLKASFLTADHPFQLGGLIYGKIPTADEDEWHGTGEADYGFVAMASKYFNRAGLHANVGYRFIGEPDGADYDDQLTYGLGLNVDITERFQFIAELTGETAYDPMMQDPLDLTSGLRVNFDNGLILGGGLRYSLGLDDDICPVGGVVQIGYSFGGVKKAAARKTPPPAPVPPPVPPSIRCLASVTEIEQGQFVEITTEVQGDIDEPLDYEWKSDGCRLEDNGSSAVFYTDSCEPGTYLVTCSLLAGVTAVDECSVSIAVMEKPEKMELKELTRDKVLFKKGARVDNIAKAKLDDFAVMIKKYPNAEIKLTGHADSQGEEDANIKLGMQRAENVKAYLVDRHQIEPSRFTVDSAGESQPVGDNETSEGRMMNRRVEIVVSGW